MRSTFTIKLSAIITVLSLLFFAEARAQVNDYEKALAKYTGDKKWDIEKPHAMDGVPAPDFEGTTVEGKKVKLSDLKGKVVVLNFWFIACVPCRLEVTPLNEIVTQFEGKDVVFISVAREKDQDLKKHLATKPFLFETIADSDYKIVNNTFHLMGYPTTIVVDKFGKIQHYTLGGKVDEDAVRKELQKTLVPIITASLQQTAEKQ